MDLSRAGLKKLHTQFGVAFGRPLIVYPAVVQSEGAGHDASNACDMQRAVGGQRFGADTPGGSVSDLREFHWHGPVELPWEPPTGGPRLQASAASSLRPSSSNTGRNAGRLGLWTGEAPTPRKTMLTISFLLAVALYTTCWANEWI